MAALPELSAEAPVEVPSTLTILGARFERIARAPSPAWYDGALFGWGMAVWETTDERRTTERSHAASWHVGPITVHGAGPSHEEAALDAVKNGHAALRALTVALGSRPAKRRKAAS